LSEKNTKSIRTGNYGNFAFEDVYNRSAPNLSKHTKTNHNKLAEYIFSYPLIHQNNGVSKSKIEVPRVCRAGLFHVLKLIATTLNPRKVILYESEPFMKVMSLLWNRVLPPSFHDHVTKHADIYCKKDTFTNTREKIAIMNEYFEEELDHDIRNFFSIKDNIELLANLCRELHAFTYKKSEYGIGVCERRNNIEKDLINMEKNLIQPGMRDMNSEFMEHTIAPLLSKQMQQNKALKIYQDAVNMTAQQHAINTKCISLCIDEIKAAKRQKKSEVTIEKKKKNIAASALTELSQNLQQQQPTYQYVSVAPTSTFNTPPDDILSTYPWLYNDTSTPPATPGKSISSNAQTDTNDTVIVKPYLEC